MYHHGTLEEQKRAIEDSMSNPSGAIRVLFCTSSFGTGIDVKGCNYCIHFGPTSTIAEYLQQSGRIGRDGGQSYAHLLLHKNCFKGMKIEQDMKEFAKGSLSCRRRTLLKAIDNPTSAPLEIKHLCCDICARGCRCIDDKCFIYLLIWK